VVEGEEGDAISGLLLKHLDATLATYLKTDETFENETYV
jgi:hypothetical protein